MTKKILSVAFCLAIGIASYADSYKLNVIPASGNTSSWNVSDIQKLTFESGNMVVTLKDGTKNSFAISGINSFNFSDATGISTVSVAEGVDANWDGQTFSITGMTGSQVQVIALNGTQLYNATLGANGQIDLSNLPKGTYMINVAGKTFKVAVK